MPILKYFVSKKTKALKKMREIAYIYVPDGDGRAEFTGL